MKMRKDEKRIEMNGINLKKARKKESKPSIA